MSDLLDEAHEFLLCMDKMEYADALFSLRAELTEARRQLAAQPAVPEAVAKDAARYRWLRDQHKRHLGLTICKVNMFDLEPWSGDDPDTAIDAAILSATDSEGRSNG